MKREDFGILVSMLRSRSGMSQDELANAIGRTRDTVAKVEQGRADWPPRTALLAFRALNSPPMAESDARAYLQYSGLDFAHFLESSPHPPLAQAPHVQSTTAQDVAALLATLSNLVDRLGIATVMSHLRQLGPTITLSEAPARELVMSTPAKPSPTVPGALEYEEIRYSQKPKSPEAIKRIRKAR